MSVTTELELVSGNEKWKAFPTTEAKSVEDLEWCREAERAKEVFTVQRDPETYYEVKIGSDVTLEDYRDETPAPIWELMEAEVAPLVGKTGFVLSSTYEGGGVAMQEPPIIKQYQEMGVDAHWLVSEPDPEAFLVTKKMHNLQQDVLDPDIQFTDEDKAKHQEYGLRNFEGMMQRVPGFADADFYWIEDPQLAAMVPKLMELNPNATFVYRNHIQTDRDKMATPGSPQNRIYEYLRDECDVGEVDTYVAHPVEQFVPYGTLNVAYMPPTSDSFEDLNRSQSEEEKELNLRWIDGQIMKQNFLRQEQYRQEFVEKYGVEPAEEDVHRDDQEVLDKDRKWLTGFARFDKAKGQEYNMRLQMLITDKMRDLDAPESLIPHTIITGNGATDDPDRNKVLGEMLELRRTKYAGYQDYITVVGLEHDYGAVNTLLSESTFTENFSTKEGFEHRRTESMIKGVPSLSTNAGGLPLQGRDGEGGLVADLENMDAELERIADEIVGDLLDPESYQARREATLEWAETFSLPELTTVANIIRESRILNGKGDRQWQIGEMVRQRGQEPARKLGARVLR